MGVYGGKTLNPTNAHLSLVRRCFGADLHETGEVISVVMKNNLQNSAGSLNTIIPTKTVPTAPIPVHTA